MISVGIVFPHQLFEQNILVTNCNKIYLIEEHLFFSQLKFHKQKIAFHRASMKYYEQFLQSLQVTVHYIDSFNELSDIRLLIPYLKKMEVNHIEYIDTTDDWLEKRISITLKKNQQTFVKHNNPQFLNTSQEISSYFMGKKRMFQTDFYKHQRLSRKILIDSEGKPAGGKWTYDDENRLKYPKDKKVPTTHFQQSNIYHTEANKYTKLYFPENYGELNSDYLYPVTFDESKEWLELFLSNRFLEFGSYEDAIVDTQIVLHHSLLTPMLNTGLLTPQYILKRVFDYVKTKDIPLNSVEGFIRQIIGWREFIRSVYELKGREQRTKNYWGFTRKIPQSFWEGTTGIEPIDQTIKKVLATGYCHHIERLMLLGNFMLLCEFDPNEVYNWFMELFIDAYDWVMVPNVYGMSQFADGGIMSSKPYISGSNYLMKMSNYKKGEWQNIWDGLFWRFLHTHRIFFMQNPRMGMLVGTFDKMQEAKQKVHLKNADDYLKKL